MEKNNIQSTKNNLTLFFFVAFIFSAITNTYSQTVRYDSVNKQKFVLVDVQKTYQRIVDKGYESLEIYEFLSNYYYENNNPKKSKLYFDKLFGKYDLSKISPKSKERYQIIKK